MARFKVRKGFCVYLKGDLMEQPYPEGQEIELNDQQFDQVKHQVEPVVKSRAKEVSSEA
jgi:hypothetical protein